MQDRFKFRFWDKNINLMIRPSTDITDEEWQHAASIYGHDEWWYCVELGLTTALDYFDNKNFELMQCTGLKDKNGKLIYEGDIIYKKGSKNWKKEKMYSKVVWCEVYAEFNISDEDGLHRMPSNPNNVEVLGNIYENPELLQDK